MSKKWINPERVVSIFGFVFLSVAFLSTFFLDEHVGTLVPYERYTARVIHGICLVLTLFTIFKTFPELEISVLYVESLFTILTFYEQLGIFLFYSAIIYTFAKGKFTKHYKLQLFIFFIVHVAAIVGTYKRGWASVALNLASSLFYLSFFTMIYDLLKSKLSCFLPTNITKNRRIPNQPGTKIHLTDYNLSERQINLLLDYLHNNLNYKELSEKYFMSLSLVKKEFTNIFKTFDVQKMDELYILLMQYIVEK